MKSALLKIVALGLLTACSTTSVSDKNCCESGCKISLSNSPKHDLSKSQRESLLFMWEEEKIARDVYLTLGDQYNLRIFSNISSSEQRHMDAIKMLLEKYEIPLYGSEKVGKFYTFKI